MSKELLSEKNIKVQAARAARETKIESIKVSAKAVAKASMPKPKKVGTATVADGEMNGMLSIVRTAKDGLVPGDVIRMPPRSGWMTEKVEAEIQAAKDSCKQDIELVKGDISAKRDAVRSAKLEIRLANKKAHQALEAEKIVKAEKALAARKAKAGL